MIYYIRYVHVGDYVDMWGLLYKIMMWTWPFVMFCRGHGHSSRRSPGISPRPWRFPLVSFVLSWNRFAKTWQVAKSVWCLPEMDPFCSTSKHMCLLFLCVQASGKELDSCGFCPFLWTSVVSPADPTFWAGRSQGHGRTPRGRHVSWLRSPKASRWVA